MENVEIIGVGYAQAQQKVTNLDLSKVVDTNDEWIQKRTGIESRYITKTENTSDLALRASLCAIKDAHIDRKEIDLILCTTTTPDCLTPSTACLVQEKLGLNDSAVMAFDINAACSGFVYGLQIASYMLKQYKCALVIGAETLSKILDWSDRSTCVLFGDGAGAAILKASTTKQMAFFGQSKGDAKGLLQLKGWPIAPLLQNKKSVHSYLKMDGKEVFRFALDAMQKSIYMLLERENIDLEDIDLWIPHQANIRIIQHVAKRIGLPLDKVYTNLQEYGNTSAASIAIALADAKEKGVLKEGMKVLLVGFGAGLTYGAVYIEW